jgi:hypothetical protein
MFDSNKLTLVRQFVVNPNRWSRIIIQVHMLNRINLIKKKHTFEEKQINWLIRILIITLHGMLLLEILKTRTKTTRTLNNMWAGAPGITLAWGNRNVNRTWFLAFVWILRAGFLSTKSKLNKNFAIFQSNLDEIARVAQPAPQ